MSFVRSSDVQRYSTRLQQVFSRCIVSGDCWIWQGYCDKDGYARISGRCGHRYVYRRLHSNLGTKMISSNLHIRHQCHQRACLRPGHLKLGTRTENMRDKDQHHTQIHGAHVFSSKLTDTKALRIYQSPCSARVLAERYGVSPNTIYKIKRKQAWVHVTGTRADILRNRAVRTRHRESSREHGHEATRQEYEEAVKRFFLRITKKRAMPNDSSINLNDPWCWCYPQRNSAGYGIGSFRRKVYLHRVVSELFHNNAKPLARGRFALHKCQEKSCINPDHLYIGSTLENSYDTLRSGNHNQVKLTPEKVHNIRQSSESVTQLAKRYHVSPTTIRNVLSKKTWKGTRTEEQRTKTLPTCDVSNGDNGLRRTEK